MLSSFAYLLTTPHHATPHTSLLLDRNGQAIVACVTALDYSKTCYVIHIFYTIVHSYTLPPISVDTLDTFSRQPPFAGSNPLMYKSLCESIGTPCNTYNTRHVYWRTRNFVVTNARACARTGQWTFGSCALKSALSAGRCAQPSSGHVRPRSGSCRGFVHAWVGHALARFVPLTPRFRPATLVVGFDGVHTGWTDSPSGEAYGGRRPHQKRTHQWTHGVTETRR